MHLNNKVGGGGVAQINKMRHEKWDVTSDTTEI